MWFFHAHLIVYWHIPVRLSKFLREIRGGGQDTLPVKKTIDEQKNAQSDTQGHEDGTGADRKQDGWVTLAEEGTRSRRTRLTSCSGWTKPPRNQVRREKAWRWGTRP
ncbi:hypothetical protein PoB_006238900 [Plakobranchus ocellatus]|uniref:Uncharacterized protein n=1 Tax=Plakobranchus ocellatus TaxID=259542 RepID=A0AAV4CVG4_9GAST|nr:hypothetical protein PoB_006238900 [Plakobranchus ocellatus]